MIAQRVPVWLRAVYAGSDAVIGPARDTLDVLIIRIFELGRLCEAAPSTPG